MTSDPTDLRQRIAKVLTTTSRAEWPYTPGQEKWDHHKHGDQPGHTYSISCALCTGDVDRLADVLAAVLPLADRAAVLAEVLPDWEAVYEPGNVSNYLIGYANGQDAATGMAEAWMRSQAEVTGRLEWVSEERMATGRYDRWFELIERHDDGVDTGPGIVVRRRLADEAQQDGA